MSSSRLDLKTFNESGVSNLEKDASDAVVDAQGEVETSVDTSVSCTKGDELLATGNEVVVELKTSDYCEAKCPSSEERQGKSSEVAKVKLESRPANERSRSTNESDGDESKESHNNDNTASSDSDKSGVDNFVHRSESIEVKLDSFPCAVDLAAPNIQRDHDKLVKEDARVLEPIASFKSGESIAKVAQKKSDCAADESEESKSKQPSTKGRGHFSESERGASNLPSAKSGNESEPSESKRPSAKSGSADVSESELAEEAMSSVEDTDSEKVRCGRFMYSCKMPEFAQWHGFLV